MEIELTPRMLSRLLRAVNGRGGFQALLRKLRNQIVGNILVLDASDLEKIGRYSFAYGGGGFEDRTIPVAASPQLSFTFE